ncbi:MAG: YlxR family protein [Clostridia bacterium]|nr:YlxR family protein [Clostridia bacterium]
MRMCVACREMRAKKDLMRIVRTAEGELKLDLTGKLSGRGAYLCRDAACMNKAIKTRALERALEAPMNDELRAALDTEIGHNDGSAV